MRVRILDTARDDLIQGFHFYDQQESGLGDYFLSSLYADIEALNFFFRNTSEGISRLPQGTF